MHYLTFWPLRDGGAKLQVSYKPLSSKPHTAWQAATWFLVVLIGTTSQTAHRLVAQAPQREDDWLIENNEDTGELTQIRELTICPTSEPSPALKHQLIPDNSERKDGNSALYYLKAMGFFEQSATRQKIQEYYSAGSKQAAEEGKDYRSMPPWIWLDTAPEDLPVDEVKQYLAYFSFQPPMLRDAAMQRGFSLDRHMQDVENPIGYLLPEIQTFRETARTQSLRTRVAIAEDDVAAAQTILGQQFAMANHLSKDDFLVSGLVGAAIAGIAWSDALYLSEHPNAPNLYWAYAALPKPIVELSNAYAYERQLVYEQIKVLREVDQTPRGIEYWQDFVDRLLPQLHGLGVEGFDLGGRNESIEMQRTRLVASIAAAYPGAKRYLVEDLHMNLQQVEAYPTAQVVLLAVCRYYEHTRDEQFKWLSVPLPQALASPEYRNLDQKIRAEDERIGFASGISRLLLPAIQAIRFASHRNELGVALLQTIESLRDYAASHAGKLPTDLSKLRLPAPLDPFTGQMLDYQFNGDHAVLRSDAGTVNYRLVIRVAP